MEKEEKNKMENQKPNGALWTKTSKAGNEYFSGKITIEGKEYYISAVKNKKSTPENRQPNYNIYLKDEVKKDNQNNQDNQDIKLEDIPF